MLTVLDIVVQIAAVIVGIAALSWLLGLGAQFISENLRAKRELWPWWKPFALWERDRWWHARATFRWGIALPILAALLAVELPFYSFWHGEFTQATRALAQVWREDTSLLSFSRFGDKVAKKIEGVTTADPAGSAFDSTLQSLRRVGFWHDFAHAGFWQIAITIVLGIPLLVAVCAIVLALIILYAIVYLCVYLSCLLAWLVLYSLLWLLSGLVVFATDLHLLPTLLCPLLARWPLYPFVSHLLDELSPSDGLPSVRQSQKLAERIQHDTQSVRVNTDLAHALNAYLQRLQKLIR